MRRRLMGCSENITFVKSLISHGTEYIKTEISIDKDILLEAHLFIEKFNKEFENYFGIKKNEFGLIRNRLASELLLLYGNAHDGSYKRVFYPPKEVKITMDSLNDSYIFNGEKGQFDTALGNEFTSRKMWIFTKESIPYNEKPEIPGSFKLYSFKMSKASTKERLFEAYPALDSNGVACLYDVVNKKFLYNDGSGTFGYETFDGNVINP